jgi:hypothetical protein
MSIVRSCGWIVTFVWTCGICCGQSTSIGVIAGARATDDLTGAGATSVSKRFLVGPAINIRLPRGFAFEVDALYRREGYQTGFANFASISVSEERANSWEFPLLLKYRPPLAPRLFVEGGYAPRLLRGSISTDGQLLFPQPTPVQHSTSSTNWPTRHGIVLGGGVQFEIGRLQIEPGLRYTRWNSKAISGFYPDGPSWQSTQNQFDILVRMAWRIR